MEGAVTLLSDNLLKRHNYFKSLKVIAFDNKTPIIMITMVTARHVFFFHFEPPFMSDNVRMNFKTIKGIA